MHTEEKCNHRSTVDQTGYDRYWQIQFDRVLWPQKSFYAPRVVRGGWTMSVAVRVKTHRETKATLGTFSARGSSTGSAVAVASGFSTLAIGTDTIGSLITPANRAALYALKPTAGVVPMDGIFNLSKTFDAVGGMVSICISVSSYQKH